MSTRYRLSVTIKHVKDVKSVVHLILYTRAIILHCILLHEHFGQLQIATQYSPIEAKNKSHLIRQ